MDDRSRVGVIDKSAAILNALELGPLSLAELVTATDLPRPTAHRLAAALSEHGLVDRTASGDFQLGSRLTELAAARQSDRLPVLARPILLQLRDTTGESTQLYVRRGDTRICIAGADLSHGLRDTVPVGAVLTLGAGSAAQVLRAWADDPGPFPERTMATVRRHGYAHSVGEREPGVASLSAPVRSPSGQVVAALSLSGPGERLNRDAVRRLSPPLLAAAAELSERIAGR